ncbi:DinB family protein [Pseudomonas sp. NPDC090202]|uniref:DinB family protein n=1 Tax=unclassified Pseudomonas TaxID=196821 RepID=UPI0038236673
MYAALFKFKAKSNREILAELAKSGLDATQLDGMTAIRTMNHTYVVDQIFKAHLTGATHSYVAANTVETPMLAELQAQIAELDAWWIDYVSALTAEQLAEQIDFAFTDGKQGSMTREEILLHVITHGCYHRGAVGLVLTRQGMTAPPETFTRYLHEAEPARRNAGSAR